MQHLKMDCCLSQSGAPLLKLGTPEPNLTAYFFTKAKTKRRTSGDQKPRSFAPKPTAKKNPPAGGFFDLKVSVSVCVRDVEEMFWLDIDDLFQARDSSFCGAGRIRLLVSFLAANGFFTLFTGERCNF